MNLTPCAFNAMIKDDDDDDEEEEEEEEERLCHLFSVSFTTFLLLAEWVIAYMSM